MYTIVILQTLPNNHTLQSLNELPHGQHLLVSTLNNKANHIYTVTFITNVNTTQQVFLFYQGFPKRPPTNSIKQY